MRIRAEEKVATRKRILEAARRLFSTQGWADATTRRIAASAGIATGTLFNYFRTKEAMAAELMAQALEEAREEFRKRRRGDEPLEEEMFSFIWTGLRRLSPYRNFVGPALTILSPLSRASPEHEGEPIRVDHLETVQQMVREHGLPELSLVSLQLYWTLHLGVLSHWAADESPNQEDTQAILDHSLRLFVASLDKSTETSGKPRDSKVSTKAEERRSGRTTEGENDAQGS